MRVRHLGIDGSSAKTVGPQEMLEVLSDPAEQVARANAHVRHAGCKAAVPPAVVVAHL